MQSCHNLEDTSVVEYACESLVLQPFHDQLMQLIVREHQTEGEEISCRCTLMNSLKLDMSSLGTEVDLDSFRPRDQIKQLISEFADRKTPIEKMACFRDILNMIREDLNKCIADAHSPFDPSPLKTLVPDDLVAATIFTLTQNPAQDICYHLNFVQTFGTHLPAMNELAYSMVTFEVALGFIRNYKQADEREKSVTGSGSGDGAVEEVAAAVTVFPWQNSPEQSPSGGKERSSSFMSYRTRDPRYDQHLKELSRLVDDISFTNSTGSAMTSSPDVTSSSTGDTDEDLGSVSITYS